MILYSIPETAYVVFFRFLPFSFAEFFVWAADVEDKVKYPTSVKKPAKDWDRLEAEVKKEVCSYANY